ncbi:MAG: GGDEF domain-containing protein [Eubacterium sp.]
MGNKINAISRFKEQYKEIFNYSILLSAIILVRVFLLLFGQIVDCRELININMNLWFLILLTLALIITKHYTTLLYVLYADVIIMSMWTCFCMGWNSAFSVYAMSIIPISYFMVYSIESFKHKIFTPTLLAVINLITVSVCKYYIFSKNIVSPISEHMQVLLAVFNYVASGILIIVFCCFFIVELKSGATKVAERTLELEYLAKYDVNTKLRNRRGAMTEMNDLAAVNREFCVAMGDIDNFKNVNDTYGHNVGDDVLRHFSEIFVQVIGDDGIVCRWGGEEFLIVGRLNMGDFLSRLYEIQTRVNNMSFSANGKSFKVTMTFGAEEYDIDKTFDGVIKTADERLYYGKQHGKNCVIHEDLS